MKKIFIDGSSGTTGLRIRERLEARKDIELIILPDELRKDPAAKYDAMMAADIAFLCLPDDAARETVQAAAGMDTVIIDTSTAHRVSPDFTYGFPEITGREKIAEAKRIANPGCHASGFIALTAPLVKAGIILPDAELCCFSITGYSGGGKKMIAQYEADDRSPLLKGPRQYGITQMHKHLPEMTHVCGLDRAPMFSPIVGDFYAGMEVSIQLHADTVKGNAADIADVYRGFYGTDGTPGGDTSKKPHGGLVHFSENADEAGFLSAAAYAGRDDMEISVSGCDERILLTARYDNLGKGASGAAIQNMNIVMGADETEGLVTGHKEETE